MTATLTLKVFGRGGNSIVLAISGERGPWRVQELLEGNLDTNLHQTILVSGQAQGLGAQFNSHMFHGVVVILQTQAWLETGLARRTSPEDQREERAVG